MVHKSQTVSILSKHLNRHVQQCMIIMLTIIFDYSWPISVSWCCAKLFHIIITADMNSVLVHI
jgi:hypothetical protein